MYCRDYMETKKENVQEELCSQFLTYNPSSVTPAITHFTSAIKNMKDALNPTKIMKTQNMLSAAWFDQEYIEI